MNPFAKFFGSKKGQDKNPETLLLESVLATLNGLSKRGLSPMSRDEYRAIQPTLDELNALTDWQYSYLVESVRVHLYSAIDVAKVLADQEVYVLLFSDKTVKIGIAADVVARANAISCAKGHEVKRLWSSGPLANAREIENAAHKQFKLARLKGEYFDISFDQAVEAIQSLLAS